MQKVISTSEEMLALGKRIGKQLVGGEVIELVGDVGTGKTTLTKGIGQGLRIDEDVQSPSFTVSREYPARDDLELHHYDFYRLSEPGILAYELQESLLNPSAVTIIEWGESVEAVLSATRLIIRVTYLATDDGRQLSYELPSSYQHLKGAL